MPPPETAGLTQHAVLWRAAAPNAYGEARVQAPEELSVRWLTGRGAAPGALGGSETEDASAQVDREVAAGSLMWEGTLAEWDPLRPQELLEVVRYRAVPDVKGREFTRRVWLRKYRGTLPAVV